MARGSLLSTGRTFILCPIDRDSVIEQVKAKLYNILQLYNDAYDDNDDDHLEGGGQEYNWLEAIPHSLLMQY